MHFTRFNVVHERYMQMRYNKNSWFCYIWTLFSATVSSWGYKCQRSQR